VQSSRGRVGRRGLTLVELILALGLFAFLMLAVFQILDRSLSLWRRAETRRALLAQAASLSDLLARDLASLDAGSRGDLLAEWGAFDTVGDGADDAKWPRLRFVRQASAADVLRLPADAAPAEPRSDGVTAVPRARAGLTEVVWLVVPASLTDRDARAEGSIWRGERRIADSSTKSLFAPDFFGRSNRPPAGATEEVGGGILWLGVLFATQTSLVHEEWKLGPDLDCVATSWDAWNRGRPDPDGHAWNEPGAGMPKARGRPLLPRRIRFEMELERPVDRLRRTRLSDAVEIGESAILVDDPTRVPREEGACVLVDGEWMRVLSVAGSSVSVKRGVRGTKAASHAPGALLHYGLRLVREIPVATYREDWNL
jgi:type II secretory pathway pseudopilin PulG